MSETYYRSTTANVIASISYGVAIVCVGIIIGFVFTVVAVNDFMHCNQLENIFNPEFLVMGCASGEHQDFDKMYTIDYCGAFVANGKPDPIEQEMDKFLKEDVIFPNMPEDVRSWKQNSKIQVQGNVATKTTVRTIKMKNGSTKDLEKVDKRTINLEKIN